MEKHVIVAKRILELFYNTAKSPEEKAKYGSTLDRIKEVSDKHPVIDTGILGEGIAKLRYQISPEDKVILYGHCKKACLLHVELFLGSLGAIVKYDEKGTI